MSKINIRKARLEDLNILLEFEQGIITAERPYDPTLKEWCLSQKITELRLDVYNDNPSAIRAYEKVGFKKHLLNMRVEL